MTTETWKIKMGVMKNVCFKLTEKNVEMEED